MSTAPPPAASFLSSYSARLSQMTTTDKASINSLTILADEHRDKIADVIKSIEDALRARDNGDARLPVLYLVDSLCQNLGRKGVPFPKLFDPIIAKIMQSTVKRASTKVRGSLYRMWNTWKTKKIFHDPPLNEIEAIFNQFLTADERMAALNRPSAAAPVDPRKRIATTVADVTVATKRAMIQDPRRASPSPSPIPPVSTPSPAPSSSVELQVLNNILNAPDIASRVDLQPLVQEIKRDIAAPLAPAQLKDMIAHAVQRLQSALSAGPATFTPIVAAPTMLPQPIGGLPFLPPTQPSVVAPPMPLSMPLPVPVVSQPFAAPPMSAWPQDPLMAANQTIPPPRTAREMAQAESSHPAITFTEADLQTPHSWVADSLYTKIPFQCKTCGRRIHNQPDMSAHIDWHFKMSARKKLLDKSGTALSQHYYWEEWEWIQAEDVIFGVQTRTPGAKSGAASNAPAPTSSIEESSPLFKKVPQNVIADEKQPKCPICGDDFKSEWTQDDTDDDWMYRNCMRLTPDLLIQAESELSKLRAADPSIDLISGGSAQATAAAEKEEDRQTQLYRFKRVMQHLRTYNQHIVHQECHYATLHSIMKSKRPNQPAPAAAPTPTPAAPAHADTTVETTNDTTQTVIKSEEPPPLE